MITAIPKIRNSFPIAETIPFAHERYALNTFNMAVRFILLSVSLSLLFIRSYSQERKEVTIYFEYNKSVLTPASETLLNNTLKTYNETHAIARVDITGHCDNTGSDQYNDNLSLQRAKTVKNYLLEHGLENTAPVTINASGETAPVNENRTEEERALNRRVVLVLSIQVPAVVATVAPAPLPQPSAPTAPVAPAGELARQITSDSVKEGSGIIMKNMNFHGGTHVLLPGSYPVLKELLSVMIAYPKLKIEIQGHVCCTKLPDGQDNDLGTFDLSVQRAKAIFQYLVVNGIDASRLSYKGFGSSKKLYPDEINEQEQAANRRVEIKIIAK